MEEKRARGGGRKPERGHHGLFQDFWRRLDQLSHIEGNSQHAEVVDNAGPGEAQAEEAEATGP
eukprot:4272817-Alexandrium_andersonii.AAC.1